MAWLPGWSPTPTLQQMDRENHTFFLSLGGGMHRSFSPPRFSPPLTLVLFKAQGLLPEKTSFG